MRFVNRKNELAALERWWAAADPRPALVWGRRRVGKTALLQRFAEGRRGIFFTGSGRPERGELAAFHRRITEVFPDEWRLDGSHTDWERTFDYLADLARDEPLLVVLDEFPELMSSSPALPGILRAFLDRQRETKLRLVLCGSSVRTMWQMQEYRAPLYGRFDLTMQLHPFRPHEAAEMLPEINSADRALAYGILGGMPLYLDLWNQSASVADNLLELVGLPTSRLLTEGELILATELDHSDHARATLFAIAHGKTRFHEIADAIGADPARALRNLISLRLVERIMPVTETERRTRLRIYRICDNFLAFYLNVATRYIPEIERGMGNDILPAMVDALSDHMGAVYEEAFRWHLRRLAGKGELGDRVVAVGPWWREGGQDQIDAVVLAQPERSRIPVLVGECKWARSVNAVRIKTDLTVKAGNLVESPGELRYAVCARDEVVNPDPYTLAITAADIFAP